MAITYIRIWLMPKSMLLTGILTTPHVGNWVVSTREETRPQSAKTPKQDHEIRIKGQTSGPLSLQMFYSFQMLGTYMHHRAPLSLPPFGPFFLINHLWSAHTGQELGFVLRFREARRTHSRGNGRPTGVQNLLDPQERRAPQVDPEAVLSLMYKVMADNKIRYGDKAGLSRPGRGGNHKQKSEVILWPAAHGVNRQERSHKTRALTAFPSRGPYGQGSRTKSFGTWEMAAISGGGLYNHECHQDPAGAATQWNCAPFPPVLLPTPPPTRWQLGKIGEGCLMWGTFPDKHWKSSQNYNT